MYLVNDDGIEPVPLSADFLLNSLFMTREDITTVGGKEVETYGIDLNTGKVCVRWMKNISGLLRVACFISFLYSAVTVVERYPMKYQN